MSLYKDASLAMIPSAYKDGKLYSIRPTDGSGDFTFSRGSNLAATRVDVNGLIEKGRENLLLQSNNFDTTWGNSNSTETSGQAGYDGTNDAWRIDKTASGGYLVQGIGTSGVQTFSVYAKAGTTDWMQLLTLGSGTGSRYVFYDLTNGVIGSQSGSGTYGIDSNIESVGGGWYRCSLTFNTTLNDVRIYPAEANSVSATSGNIYIQDAQLEQGLVATDYIETTTTTAQAGILEDMPRLDYSGGASCPSLLLEPQRSNLVTQSEYINGSGLSKIGSSIDTNVSSSPEGLVNASLLKEDSSNGSHVAYRDFNLTNGATYTISIFAKSNGENRNIRLGDGGGFGWSSGFNSDFDLTLGTSTNNGVIEDYGNGWFRCSVVGTTNATSSRLIIYSILNTQTSYQGDGVSGVYLYGFQIEQGNYHTSYIPTYGSAVTRSADRAEIENGSFFPTAYPFTLYAESPIIASGAEFLFNICDKNVSDSYAQLSIGNGAPRVLCRYSGGEVNVLSPDSVSASTIKMAAVFTESSIKLFVDGELKATETNTTPFQSGWNDSLIGQLRIVADTGSRTSNKMSLLFPTALTDSECIALTTI